MDEKTAVYEYGDGMYQSVIYMVLSCKEIIPNQISSMTAWDRLESYDIRINSRGEGYTVDINDICEMIRKEVAEDTQGDITYALECILITLDDNYLFSVDYTIESKCQSCGDIELITSKQACYTLKEGDSFDEQTTCKKCEGVCSHVVTSVKHKDDIVFVCYSTEYQYSPQGFKLVATIDMSLNGNLYATVVRGDHIFYIRGNIPLRTRTIALTKRTFMAAFIRK